MTTTTHGLVEAPTQFISTSEGIQIAYRRFGATTGTPLLFLQHFTGTMDNWDPAVTDALAADRTVIVFDSAGIGRSGGKTPDSVDAMAKHALAFVDALGLKVVDLLGFSLGGFVAQQVALARPALVRRIILAGTGPEGGEDMSMLKPQLLAIFQDSAAPLSDRLLRLFFAPTDSSRSAGKDFLGRISRRQDREPMTGMDVFQARAKAIADYGDKKSGQFARLKEIKQPVLVFNGVEDIMIPSINSYTLAAHLPAAELWLVPDSGHGALFQYAQAFARGAAAFLDGRGAQG